MGRDRDDRKRSRDRSRDRNRDRSRSRDRSRDRDKRKKEEKKDKDRDRRSREREKDKKEKKHRHRSRSRSQDKKESSKDQVEDVQQQQQDEMRKRRERLKAWQEAKAKETTTTTADSSMSLSISEVETYIQKLETAEREHASVDNYNNNNNNNETKDDEEKALGWSLEDEGDEDENNNNNNEKDLPLELPMEEVVVVAQKKKDDEEEEEESSVFKQIVVPVTNAPSSSSSSSSFSSVVVAPSVGKTRRSKWSSSSSSTAKKDLDSETSFTSKASTSSQPPVQVVSMSEEDEDDPLDAFMTSLYNSGDVEVQRGVVNNNNNNKNISQSVPAKKAIEVITMDEILSSFKSAPDNTNNNNNNNQRMKMKRVREQSGWESDTGGNGEEETETSQASSPSSSPRLDQLLLSMFDSDGNIINNNNNTDPAIFESDEAREEREDRERREFVEAFRVARREEELARERLAKAATTTTTTVISKKKMEMGRVFAEEGDGFDDDDDNNNTESGGEPRKTALEIYEESRRGKAMREVDHSQVDYLPFRKNLFIVPRVLSRLTDAEVNERREDLHVKVRGKGCPCPIDSWQQCGLSERLLLLLDGLKLAEPFAIQKQAIPAIMAGRDVIGIAKTGSGKTLAFLLPMFRHIQDQPPLANAEGPIGLVMAPARELAFQISSEAKKFTKPLGMRVTCVYGGTGVADQIADLRRGADIVVCTPGRMIEILCMQAGKLLSLKRVTMVVMDEADRMFDMGFEPQIKMVLQNIRPDRQTVLFSATFPKQIEKLAKTVLRLPLEIVVGERSTVNKDITQYVEVHEEEDKFLRLLQLLGVWYEKGSVLVFVDKQEKCDQLFQELLKLGYPCLSLHGGKEQVDRDHTLHEFKTGIKTVMIATSVAGRGLDVPDIVVVVNYNCPNHLEDYVHRVGRTGRAGRKGTAYTFISSKEDQYASLMVRALEKAKQKVPEELQQLLLLFKAKVDRGEAVQHSSGGFVGKGFTFDSSEMNEAQKLVSMQRKAYELEQGIDISTGLEEEQLQSGTYSLEGDDEQPQQQQQQQQQLLLQTSTDLKQRPTTTSAVTAIDPSAALARAKLIAQQMDSITAASCAILGLGDDRLNHFSDELEMNDYPPQARRKASHRTTVEEIIDRTGVAIMTRGIFIAAGKKPDPGERKLHFLIEGQSELSVRQAKLDLLRVLEEETIRLGTTGGGMSGSGGGGRYSVL